MPKSPHSRVSIVSLARQLGISTTTVHAALTGSAPVAETTRERVLAMAAAQGYHPNLHARALRTQQSHLIGMIAPGLRMQFFGESFEALDVTADDAGYTLLHVSSRHRAERERAQCEHFLGLAAAGVVIVSSELCTVNFYNSITAHIPMLFIAQMPVGVQADLVAIDEYRGGYLAGEHLARGGRRQIIFFAPPQELHAEPWVQERLRGCTDALAAAGVAAPVVVTGPPQQCFDLPGSYTALDAVLAHGMRCDGIFAANDNLAYGAIGALQARGRRVPDDVAVIGYDNIDMPRPELPLLTTVAYPFTEIGVQGMHLLLRRIHGEETGDPQILRVSPTLLARDTA